MILDYVSLPIFLISLAVGLFVVYALGPEQKIVYIFPTPKNIKRMLFKDKTDECFSYKSEEVECPTDTSLMHVAHLQT